MKEFLPIILGSDLNTYSIAREIYEAYGIMSVGATSMILSPCINSKIINFYKKHNFSKDPVIFAEVLNTIYHDHENTHENFIIFAPDDTMRSLIFDNLDRLDFRPLLPYAPIDVINALRTKKDFYKGIEDLDLAPKTLLATVDNYRDLDYPADVFIKADNDVAYRKLDFDGWQKGYHSKSQESTIEILEKVFESGYEGAMIVQEFVVGGDGTEYSIDGYRSKSTISMSVCQNVLLDKRVEWIGNFVAKIDTDEKIILDYGKQIVETLGVYGFFNIDFKKDIRTGKIYAFEINLRQGRCHYYASQNGVNTSAIAIEDLVFDNPQEIIGDEPFAYYNLLLEPTIENLPEDLKDAFISEERAANTKNPLIYAKDNNFIRKMKIHSYLDKLSVETFAVTEV